ncbi:MAG: glutamate racemase [Bacteroidota bacterium]
MNQPPGATSLHPIGIYDSGIGGLTVARALSKVLPNEDFIYFGDTAHLPYGDKSTAAIQAYSVKISEVLLRQPVKAILIACNSASAAAFELVKEYAGSKAIVLNVIDPVVDFIKTNYAGKKIGLIGTRQTVQSNVYLKKLNALDLEIQLSSLATPLLAPMIEEGFFNNNISHNVIHEYLDSPVLNGIEALILGCTHYPLISKEIEEYYKGRVAVIDSSDLAGKAMAAELSKLGILNEKGMGTKRFFVSDYTRSFAESTQIFFGEKAELEHYPLWE